MKIVCESCGAKYSIADDKVIGKVFKIRCKKCSDTIVVRGDQMDNDDEEATRVFDFGDGAVWHVVVDGQQQGPFAPIQITGLLNTGKIDQDAYVWKEGFEGWLPLRDVPELSAQVGDSSAPDASPEDEAAFESDDAAPSADDAADDPFAATASAPVPSEEPAKDDLFGDDAGAADPFAASSEVVSSAPATSQPSQPETMTGARNENSVLFSLSNLQGLGASAPTSSSSSSGFGSASQPASSQPAGAAAGDASGLIDIRNLAAAATATSAASKPSAESAVDDLLSVGTGVSGLGGGQLGSSLLGGGRAFGAPAAEEAAPVAAAAPAPAAPPASKMPMVLAALAIVALAAVVVVLLLRDDPAPVAVVTPDTQQPAEATATGAAPSGETPAAAAADEEKAEEAKDAPEEAKEEEPAAAATAPTKTASSSSSMSSSTKSTSSMTTSQPSSSMTTSMTSSSSSMTTSSMTTSMAASGDISSLLDKAVSGGSSMTSGSSSAASSNLPDTPSRSAVSSALGAVAPQARACGNGTEGTARAAVTFTGSTGRVSNVSVSGVDATVARCVERAARNAKVPAFKQSTFNVTYPFRVQ